MKTQAATRQAQVGLIEPVGGHSGMDYYDFGLAAGLAAAGWGVTLYTCDETVAPAQRDYAVHTFYERIYGDDPAWRRGLRYLRGTLRTLFEMRRNGARIAHFHFFHVGYLEFINVVLARLLGRRVVITAHDVDSFVAGLTVKGLTARTYRLAYHVIAHSRVGKRELQQSLGLADAKVTYVPIGNYLHAIGAPLTRAAARRQLALPETGPIVLFLGQIKAVKGVDLLLNAFPAVLRAHPDATLVIAGRVWKDDIGTYEKLATDLGLGDRCLMRIGFVPDADMPAYHHAADLIVLPYRRIYQSASLYMAMAYGTPILASDIEGMQELVTNGDNGFLFESGNADALARCMINLLDAPERAQAAAQRAIERMRSEYSWDQIGARTLAAYRAALD